MENKFDTYNASQIVPQMTLLQKFNKLIKYLHENVYVNVFPCYVAYTSESTPYNISNLNLGDRKIMVGDIVVFTNNYCAFVASVSVENFTVTQAQSFKGAKGDKGDTGDTGAQGVSVTLVQVNSQNHLILRLSNNTTIDAGVIYANREKIELTGSFDENLEMEIEITQLQYNRLVQKDISLLITDTTSGYVLSFSKSVNENSENVDVYYTSSFATNNFTAIVQKVTDGEQQVIGYAITVNGFALATESSLSEKQDVLTFDNAPTENSDNPVKSGGVYSALGDKQNNLTPSSVNDGTIDKVLGFDNSNNLIKGAVSGGTKLYKHEITVKDGNSLNKTTYITSIIGTPCNDLQSMYDLYRASLLSVKIGTDLEYLGVSGFYNPVNTAYSSFNVGTLSKQGNNYYFYQFSINNSGAITVSNLQITSFVSDTVTEL